MDFTKLLLLGGGGYFLYQWLQGQNAIPSITGTTGTTPAATTTPSPADSAAIVKAAADKAAAEKKAASDAVTAATTTGTDERILERLAADAAFAKGTKGSLSNRLYWDQWNWYLAKWDSPTSTARTGPATTHTMYGIEDVGLTDRYQLLSAEEYHDLKTAKGLSGYGPRGFGNIFIMRNAWPENHRRVTDRNAV